MLKKRKLLAGLATALIITSACAVSASAVSLTVHLHASESAHYSAKADNYFGNGKMKGSNWSESAGSVKFIAKYQVGLIWRQGQNVELAPGGNLGVDGISINPYSKKTTWQMGLNPAGALQKGCTADGELRLDS